MNRSPILPALILLAACNSDGDADAPTYHGAAKAILDDRCVTCHQPGDVGPFPLTTHAEVVAFSAAVTASIESGSMPPWQPSDDCNTYEGNIDLTDAEKDLLLDWLAAGAPEGDPSEAPAVEAPDERRAGFEADIVLQLPEAYTPTKEPDDYRCQLIPWPEDAGRYVTGLRVVPDQRAIVHHTIAFVVGPDQVAEFQAYDDAEEGPGYTCYGGPTAGEEGSPLAGVDLGSLMATLESLGLTLQDVQSGSLTPEQMAALVAALSESGGGASALGGFGILGAWVPGQPDSPLPAGTGIEVEPGSMIVAQMHYNTLSASPVADRSVIEIATTDTVDKPAVNMLIVDLGWVTDGLIGEPMTIPAGASGVEHHTEVPFDSMFMQRARTDLGLAPDAPLTVHAANHHMHGLGRQMTTTILHEDGSETCVLDIPDWDFNWQGDYQLSSPITLRPGDRLWMGCTWDNTPENQPIIDGVAKEPEDVSWGEGTTDEMCLGGFYVTRP